MSDPLDPAAESSRRRPAWRSAPGAGRPAGRRRGPRRPAGLPLRREIGIRELRQHASVYVDLAEKGYTVDITNRGRLVAQADPGPASRAARWNG